MTDAEAFDALPPGAFAAMWQGRLWHACKTRQIGGLSQKIYAEEAGGTGRVSANLYTLSGGRTCLRPCEMPEEKVRSFLLEAIVVDGTDAADRG